MRAGRGYSLIELVVVLAILGALAGVASMRFANSAERARVDAAGARVVAMIDDCRGRARTASVSAAVVFDAGHRVLIKGATRAGSGLDTVELGEPPYRVRVKQAEFGGRPELEFTPFGRPLAGGSAVIFSGVHERTITVDPETGRASIK